MIAPEYFNNHIAIEGEIIVKRVPNDTGTVLVWNSTTKKVSTRTISEIVSDLSLMTTNTDQNISGRKNFYTTGGNDSTNNSLFVTSNDGSYPAISFYRPGIDLGQLKYVDSNSGFYFVNSPNSDTIPVNAKGFIKSASSNSHVLLGGGGHKAISDFVLPSDLSNLVTTDTVQTITADKTFKKITTTDWVIPKFLAFPDASSSLSNYIGFYMWNSQWQVNWRDSSNNYSYPLLDIDGITKNATFYGDTKSPKFTTPQGNSDQWNQAYNSLNNYVSIDTDQNILGKKQFQTHFSNYHPDGLFSSDAKPLSTATPGGNNILLGYKDYGSGQYYPRVGFKNISGLTNWSLGPLGNTFVLGTENDGLETFKFHRSGATSKVQNSMAVFEKVYQGYYDHGANMGILSIKMPQAHADQAMFNIDINIYGYENQYIGKVSISFYKYVSGTIITNGSKALFDVTDNFPTETARVGIGSDGYVSILLGNPDTVWQGYFSFEVSRVEVQYGNWNLDWSEGWNHALESSYDQYGSNLITLPVDRVATRSFTNDYFVSKSIEHQNNFNIIGGYGKGGFYRADSDDGGVKYLYAPMLHLPGQDTMSQLQIQYGNGTIQEGELSYRGGFNGGWGNWRTAWDNVNLQKSEFVKNTFNFYDVNTTAETSWSHAYVNTPTWFPNDKSGTVLHKQYNDNYATQLALSYYNGMAYRHKSYGSWSNWKKVYTDDDFNIGQYVLQSSLNSQLAAYATLAAVQTFTSTNTFTQSPVIPNGTLGTHAINLNQLNNHNHSTLTSSALGAINANSLLEDYKFKFDTVVAPSSANIFPNAVDNANAIISISSHPGYGVQFGFNTFGEIYTRRLQNNSWSASWSKMITEADLSDYVTIDTTQTITGDKIFAVQPVKSNEGFQNTVYKTGQRNRIWSFGNADDWGISYYQGNGHVLGEGINFHFGSTNSTDYKIYIKDNGRIYSAIDGDSGEWRHRLYGANNYLGADYIGGGQEKPNSDYFGAGKLKLQMLDGGQMGIPGFNWSDVLWMSSYTGSDVKMSTALVSSKYNDRIGFVKQDYDSQNWGKFHEFWTSANLPAPISQSDLIDYYKTFNGGITNQSVLLPNGSQWASLANTGTDFDGELSNKTIEGTFANFNGANGNSKDLGFTLFARTSTGQGIYYKTWYGGGQTQWKRLIDSTDIQNYITLNTPQTIIHDKTFNANLYVQNGISQYNLKVDQENNIWDLREYPHVGFSYWQGAASPTFGEGFGFHFYNEIYFMIGLDGDIRTKFYGAASQWNTAYNWGNHANAGYANSSTSLINIFSPVDLHTQEHNYTWINGALSGAGQFSNWTGSFLAFGHGDHKSQFLVNKTDVWFRTEYGNENSKFLQLATRDWANNTFSTPSFLAQNYALRAGSNATDTWVNSAYGLTNNPAIPGKIRNSSGDSSLQDATYGSVMGYVNNYGVSQGNPADNWFHRVKMLHNNASGYYGEIAVQMTSGNGLFFKRYENGTDYGWIQAWDKENLPVSSINSWNTAYGWGNHKEAHSGQFLGATGMYTMDASTSVHSIPHGISSYFVDYNSGYGSYGSVLNVKTYGGGGGTLQLYTPYSTQYGGNGLKYRRFDYSTDSWTDFKMLWDSNNFNPAQYVTQSNLNSQLGNYATLNGVQTFTNTNTFAQSPVIPNGTLGTHAVNKNQIELSTNPENEGGQQLNISGNNSVSLTNYFVTSRDGSRNPNDIAPNSTPRRVRFDFATANAAGLGGSGNYAGIMTYSPWDGTSGSTGDSSYQLAFANQTGINGSGVPMLKIRKGIDGNWTTSWYKFWTEADFGLTNIQQWNYAYQYGLKLNQEFTTNLYSGLIVADDYFGGESGIIDKQLTRLIVAKKDDYYHYGSQYGDFDGLAFNCDRKLFGMGREANDIDKLLVEGSVKASKNFKSEEERPDTLFIPNGNTATLRDEIINDESEYAIRLDPHEYEIDSSGYLEVNDRNRLIHITGEEVKMVVNFKEVYPKQQIVIYNFDQYGGTMEVKIHGKPVYYIESGCFLRLYVKKSGRVIAERQQPCEFIW